MVRKARPKRANAGGRPSKSQQRNFFAFASFPRRETLHRHHHNAWDLHSLPGVSVLPTFSQPPLSLFPFFFICIWFIRLLSLAFPVLLQRQQGLSRPGPVRRQFPPSCLIFRSGSSLLRKSGELGRFSPPPSTSPLYKRSKS